MQNEMHNMSFGYDPNDLYKLSIIFNENQLNKEHIDILDHVRLKSI